ncbi:MAG: ABC transporter ATP-binding protein [Proteobacteria bacterium]|nr:ABC transporter ATP-binding protein [Pseudomonadota bacterium]
MESDQHYPVSLTGSYFYSIYKTFKIKLIVSILLMVLLSLTQGIGLLMLIPLLQLVDIGQTGEAVGGIAGLIGGWTRAVGISSSLFEILCFYVGLVTANAMGQYLQSVLSSEMTHGFTRFCRNRLYASFARANWLFILKTRSGEVTYLLTSGLQRVGQGVTQTLQLFSAVAIIAVHIAVSLVISLPLTGIALGSALFFFILLRHGDRQATLAGTSLHTARNSMFNSVSEFLGGIKTAKSFGIEQLHLHNFSEITAKMMSQFVRFAKLNGRSRMVFQIGAVVLLSVFFFGAYTFAGIPVVELFLMAYIFSRLLPRFSTLHQCYQRIRNILPTYEAVLILQQQLDAACEPLGERSHPPVTLQRSVVFRQVSFRYDSNRNVYALRSLDLVIPAKRTTAIMGPSGSGKSTLADLLMGLLTPEGGAVMVDGESLTDARVFGWRTSIGYVPQDSFVFNDTVRNNLLWSRPDADETELWRILELAAAEDFVRGLPKGLDTFLGDRGVRLSGGERQRIALARALLRNPSLLLLDEATSSLDRENERKIQDAVEKLSGELTVVVIAHRLSTIRRADKIVVLEGGRIVEEGSWQELHTRTDSRFRQMARTFEPGENTE